MASMQAQRRTRLRRGAMTQLVAWLMALSAAVAAAESPTLERIASRGEIRIGYVPDAPPMSFTDEAGEATGYSIALCANVVAHVKQHLDTDELTVRFVPLRGLEERVAAVAQGSVDIECGATTVTLTRRERIDFSLMTFITGAAVLSRAEAPIRTTPEMAGKRIGVLRDTTTEDALLRFRDLNALEIELAPLNSNAEGLKLLQEGAVDGLASDRAMLVGQALQTGKPGDYQLTQDVFSFEPYALMLPRGDTEFRLLVDASLAELYRTARIRRLYQDWFGRFGLPLPSIVEAMYEFQAITE